MILNIQDLAIVLEFVEVAAKTSGGIIIYHEDDGKEGCPYVCGWGPKPGHARTGETALYALIRTAKAWKGLELLK